MAARTNPEDLPQQSTPMVATNNNQDEIKCHWCTKLGQLSECCKVARAECELCARIWELFREEVTEQVTKNMISLNDFNKVSWNKEYDALKAQIKMLEATPERLAEHKNDRIESLKRQAEEADMENKKLQIVLEQRRQTLGELQNKLKIEGPQVVIKEAKKGKKGQK
jgi:hypothetical protein